MSENKKIRIEGDTGGLKKELEEARKAAEALAKDLIEVSANAKISGRDTVRSIEEEIRSIERRTQAQAKRDKFILDSKRDEALSSARSPQDVGKINESYKEQLRAINHGVKLDEMQVSLLRELIDTINLQPEKR